MGKEVAIVLLCVGLFFGSTKGMQSSVDSISEKIKMRVLLDFSTGIELIKTIGIKKCSLLPIEVRKEILIIFTKCASQLTVNAALAHLSSGIEKTFIAEKVLEAWNNNYRCSDHHLDWPEKDDDGRLIYTRPYDIKAYLKSLCANDIVCE